MHIFLVNSEIVEEPIHIKMTCNRVQEKEKQCHDCGAKRHFAKYSKSAKSERNVYVDASKRNFLED